MSLFKMILAVAVAAPLSAPFVGAAGATDSMHHKHHHQARDASGATQRGDNKPTMTGGQPGGAAGRS